MPVINGEYIAPTWVNGQNPPIDAQEMQDICDSVAKNQAPTSHASPNTDYGVGNDSNYGHVKLSDTADMSLGQTSGTAATPALVSLVQQEANLNHARQALEIAVLKSDTTVTGTYQGSGTYGANNKNSINFTKIPTVIYISCSPNHPSNAVLIVLVPKLKIGYAFSNTERGNTLLYVSTEGDTVSWYAEGSTGAQGSNRGKTYTYYAMY